MIDEIPAVQKILNPAALGIMCKREMERSSGVKI